MRLEFWSSKICYRDLAIVLETDAGEDARMTAYRRVEMWRGGLGLAYLFPALSSAGASLA